MTTKDRQPIKNKLQRTCRNLIWIFEVIIHRKGKVTIFSRLLQFFSLWISVDRQVASKFFSLWIHHICKSCKKLLLMSHMRLIGVSLRAAKNLTNEPKICFFKLERTIRSEEMWKSTKKYKFNNLKMLKRHNNKLSKEKGKKIDNLKINKPRKKQNSSNTDYKNIYILEL